MRTKSPTRRNAIVAAAAAEFLEKGFDGTTMSGIAERLEYSKATVYSYFSSKDELFLACMQHLGDAQFAQTFSPLERADDVAESLRGFGRSLLRVLTSDRAIAMHRLMVAGAADPSVGRRMFAQGPKKAEALVVEMLRVAVDRGQLRPCDPEVAAAHVRGLLESELVAKRQFGVLKPPPARTIASAVDRAVDTFMAAYKPSASRPRQRAARSTSRPTSN